MRKAMLVVGLTIALGIIFAVSQHTNVSALSASANVSSPPTSYEYIARPGDSLSLLTRRSLQLYSQIKNVALTPAAAMYCETNVSQKLGSRRLEINEQVNIPFDLLQQYIVSSRDLSAGQLTAWNNYAQKANFDLSDLHPHNESTAQSAAQPQSSSTSTTLNRSDNQESKTSATMTPTKQSTTTVKWLVWLNVSVGIVIVGYAFYKFKA